MCKPSSMLDVPRNNLDVLFDLLERLFVDGKLRDEDLEIGFMLQDDPAEYSRRLRNSRLRPNTE